MNEEKGRRGEGEKGRRGEGEKGRVDEVDGLEADEHGRTWTGWTEMDGMGRDGREGDDE